MWSASHEIMVAILGLRANFVQMYIASMLRWRHLRHLQLDHRALRGFKNSTHLELYARTSRCDLNKFRTQCRNMAEQTQLILCEESVIAP